MTYIPSGAHSVTAVLAAAVNDDGTFTVGYPTGTSQEYFQNGNYKAGSGQLVLNGVDVWSDADPGFAVTTFGASTITITNLTGATLAIGTEVTLSLEVWTIPAIKVTFPFPTMTTIAAGDMVTSFKPGFDGYITHVEWVQYAAVTTAGDGMDLNLEIGTTDLTGGVVALTSAACTPIGKIIHGSRITANNRLTKDDLVSVEAAAGAGAFAEGSGALIVTIRPDPV